MEPPRPDPPPAAPAPGTQWNTASVQAQGSAFLGSTQNIYNYGPAAPPPAPPPGPAFQVPVPPNPLFTGRDAALAQLDALLATGAPVAVAGTGGLGKTQLAVEYAHRQRAAYPGGVFWLTMAQPEGVDAQVAACAGPRGLALSNEAALALEQKIDAVREAWQGPERRLLVFDNCEDPALLARWRPPTGGCRVLLTSRRPTWPAMTGVRVLALAPLDRPDSVDRKSVV